MSDETSEVKESTLAPGQAPKKVQKCGLKARALHEAKHLLAMFLYLYVLFGLFNLHEYIILAQHRIEFTDYGVAFINAWIFAKVMLVAEDLPLARGLEDRPLIYPVFFKAFVFMIIFIGFRVVESVLFGLWRGQTIAESVPAFGGGGSCRHYLGGRDRGIRTGAVFRLPRDCPSDWQGGIARAHFDAQTDNRDNSAHCRSMNVSCHDPNQ